MSTSEPQRIESVNNPTVKRLVRMRDNRARRQAGRVIVDGWRETSRAISAGLELCGLFTTESGQQDAPHDSIKKAQDAESLWWVSDAVMKKIGYGDSFRGVVAEFVQPKKRLTELELPASPLLMVLDQIEKPGNVGAVFRCADAAGVDGVILCDGGTDLFNPNTIRSSLGAVFTVPAAMGSYAECTSFLHSNRIRPVAARVESSKPIWEANLDGKIAFVLGSEAHGLGDRWQTGADTETIEGVQIPMLGVVDSLNISVSAAVLAYEAVRRRSAEKP